jgi:hypothetical protein
MKLPSTTTTLLVMTGATVVAMVLVLLGSQEILWTDHAEAISPSKDPHSHEGLTWPPQPRGIDNVVVHSDVKKEEHDRAIKEARMDRLDREPRGRFRGLAIDSRVLQ